MATRKGATGKGGAEHETGAPADVDSLFQLPLVEFTAARNALSARLKKAGQAADAEHVKALAKPSLSAWVVNQLYWRHRDAFQKLIAAGERFRTAQGAQLAGKSADLREPLEGRRTALASLARLAAGTLRDAGHSATPETMRRITMTLEALSTYGALPDAPPAGRLTDDVDPPGFETLAALIPQVGRSSKGGEPTRIIPFQQPARTKTARKAAATPAEQARRQEEERQAQRARAKAAMKDADTALREARAAAQQAEAALKKAAADAKDTEREKLAAEQRFEKATAAAEEARQRARRVAAEAEEAAQAVEDAERTLDRAKRELATLD
jgi:hypothetical protein